MSARVGDGFLITSTNPLAGMEAEDVRALDADGRPQRAADDLPLEAPLHAAVYRARPDVCAICRTHSRWAVAWGVRGEVPPLLHGLGGLAGSVALARDPQLISDPKRAARTAAALGDHDCLILRANGAIATGTSLPQAAVRAWFLEERARVAHDAEGAAPLGEEELAARSAAFPVEEARAARWLYRRFAGIDGNPRRRTR